MTPDQDAALASYFAEWADQLARDDYRLLISYTADGPTLDLYAEGQIGPVIRWLLEGNTGGHR